MSQTTTGEDTILAFCVTRFQRSASTAQRRWRAVSQIVLAAPKVAFAVDTDNPPSMQYDQLKIHFDKLHAATAAAIERVVSGQNRVVKELHRRIELGEEELQMLWWLTGGHSRSAGKPFNRSRTWSALLSLRAS